MIFQNINLLLSTPAYVHWKQSARPKMSKTLSSPEHNLPYKRNIKFEKLKDLIRFWWHFMLHLQQMNNMACPAHGYFSVIWKVSPLFWFVTILTFLLGYASLPPGHFPFFYYAMPFNKPLQLITKCFCKQTKQTTW